MAKAFKSAVNIPTGSVGGLIVSSSGLNNQGSASSYAGMLSASTASYAFFAGGQNNSGSAAQFYVTPAGTLTSNSASISGVVTFTSGTLGPFTVSSSALSSSSGIFSASTGTFTGNLTASAGTTTLGITNIISSSSTTVPIVIKGASGQTVNLQQWQNSSASILANINSSGGASFPSASVGGQSLNPAQVSANLYLAYNFI
jgi:hypothetical protein